MDQITIAERKGTNYVLLEVTGTINSYTCTEFQNKVYELIRQTNLVIDMSLVSNLSSSGLGALMAAIDDGEETGHRLYIMRPSEVVRMAISSTGFEDSFSYIFSLTEVL